jgi:hypothetical protein
MSWFGILVETWPCAFQLQSDDDRRRQAREVRGNFYGQSLFATTLRYWPNFLCRTNLGFAEPVRLATVTMEGETMSTLWPLKPDADDDLDDLDAGDEGCSNCQHAAEGHYNDDDTGCHICDDVGDECPGYEA